MVYRAHRGKLSLSLGDPTRRRRRRRRRMPRWSRGVLVSSFRATRCVGGAAATAFRVCHRTRAGRRRAEGERLRRASETAGAREGRTERERARASSVLEGKREEGDGAPVGYHTQHRASREPIAERTSPLSRESSL